MVDKRPEQLEHFVSWNDFESLMRALVEGIKPLKGTIKYIYGIPRGGQVIAVRLSHMLDIPLTEKVKEGTLIVDDIADSGKTIEKYKDYLTCTLLYKEKSNPKPDVMCDLVPENVWIIFPWEVK